MNPGILNGSYLGYPYATDVGFVKGSQMDTLYRFNMGTIWGHRDCPYKPHTPSNES